MQNLLIIGYVWPEPTATAAGCRMLQIIEQFQKSDFEITFVSTAKKAKNSFDLSSLGINIHSIVLNDTSFDEFIQGLKPDVVLFDRFMIEEQFGWRVIENCPNAIRILDSEDLHFLRKARQQSVKKQENLPEGIINSEDAKREIASIYRCDVTLTISEFEMKYLQEQYKIPAYLLWYFPFLVENGKSLSNANFEECKDFMFIGNFIHAPNWDAVLQLKNVYWPKIRKQLPKANLHIYGGYPSEKVFQLHNVQQGFLVHGRANSVDEVMQKAKVCLVPLRFGAGLKGKIIDAMQNNLPFVTSKIGAEGMFGEMDMTSVVAENTEDFINKSITLYEDKEFWMQMVGRGKDILCSRFSKEKYREGFVNRLKEVQQNFQKNRKLNFTGAMLQHNTLQSTKYLSKWIESKNSKN